jgi:hypothetical protein
MSDVGERIDGMTTDIGSAVPSLASPIDALKTESSDIDNYPSAPFRLEREMIDPLLRALPMVLPRSSPDLQLHLVSTPSIGSIIPDVLAAFWPHATPVLRMKGVTYIEAVLLSLVQDHGAVSSEQILKHVHLPMESVMRAMARLRSRALVFEDSSGIYSLTPILAAAQPEIIAVEVKLRRWRDALAQAVNYATFANRSYVVLDGTRMTVRLDVLNHFRDCGVGLFLQFGDQLRPVVDADYHQSTGPARFLALRHLSDSVRHWRPASQSS